MDHFEQITQIYRTILSNAAVKIITNKSNAIPTVSFSPKIFVPQELLDEISLAAKQLDILDYESFTSGIFQLLYFTGFTSIVDTVVTDLLTESKDTLWS
jgi:hypothetical protein